MLQNWYNKSPGDFLFAMKAPRLITHFKQLADCERYLGDFYSTCRDGLQDKLGPVLFQFPATFIYTPERMERIVKVLNHDFRNVIEFRDKSWWNKKVYAACEKCGLIFCGLSYPGLPDDVVITSSTGYYRFHGLPKIYYSVYRPAYLRKLVDSMLQKKRLSSMYCYFNNTAGPGAVANARWIEDYLREATGATKMKKKKQPETS